MFTRSYPKQTYYSPQKRFCPNLNYSSHLCLRMRYDKNIVSSCSAIAGFDIDTDTFCRTKERLRTLQQLQPLQYGFINNSPNKIKEINSGMGGLYTCDGYVLAHYMPDLMRHRASLEASSMSILRLHTCGCDYSNNIPSPPWRGSVVSMAITERECQYLHAIIDEGNPTNAAMILSEVKDCLHELMMHRFGSTLIKKIFEAKKGMTMEQMDFLVYLILANDQKLWDVCINYHGYVYVIKVLNYDHVFLTKSYKPLNSNFILLKFFLFVICLIIIFLLQNSSYAGDAGEY